jgi:hypothetical protein
MTGLPARSLGGRAALTAALGVVVLAAGTGPAVFWFLWAIASADARPTDPSTVEAVLRRDRLQHAQFECIRESVIDQVAPGSSVFVPLDPAAPEPDLWQQRLIELAYPVATIVEAPGVRTLTLRVTQATPSECNGVRLVVERG